MEKVKRGKKNVQSVDSQLKLKQQVFISLKMVLQRFTVKQKGLTAQTAPI